MPAGYRTAFVEGHSMNLLPTSTVSATQLLSSACEHCGSYHTGQCPRVKAAEYYRNGKVKRVEYHAPISTIYVGALPSPLEYAPVPYKITCKITCGSVGVASTIGTLSEQNSAGTIMVKAPTTLTAY